MPRYYFDICDEFGELTDKDGQELSDSEAARREAMVSLGAILKDHGDRKLPKHIAIEVRDQRHRIVRASFTLEVIEQ